MPQRPSPTLQLQLPLQPRAASQWRFPPSAARNSPRPWSFRCADEGRFHGVRDLRSQDLPWQRSCTLCDFCRIRASRAILADFVGQTFCGIRGGLAKPAEFVESAEFFVAAGPVTAGRARYEDSHSTNHARGLLHFQFTVFTRTRFFANH